MAFSRRYVSMNEVKHLWKEKIFQNGHSKIKDLHEFQLDVITCIINGDNTILAAGTGMGKTLPMLYASMLMDKGPGLLIPPTTTIGMQMINIMKESNIPFASLYDYNESSTLDGAKIIIGSIETVVGKAFESLLMKNISYVAIDEAHILDKDEGWKSFRCYDEDVFLRMRATWNAPFVFCSGTLNNTILKQIGEHTQVSLDSFQIIQAKGTQNVYHSVISSPHKLEPENYEEILKPVLNLTKHGRKIQLFVRSLEDINLLTAWLRERFEETDVRVAKINGLSSDDLKRKTLHLFANGQIDLLVCSDVAVMGWDVPKLDFSVLLGRSSCSWKYFQIEPDNAVQNSLYTDQIRAGVQDLMDDEDEDLSPAIKTRMSEKDFQKFEQNLKSLRNRARLNFKCM